MKKAIILVMAVLMICSMAACGEKAQSAPAAKPVETPKASSSATDASSAESAAIPEAFAEAPALITSAGQSADFEMLKVVFDNNGVSYTADITATKEHFGDAKTLVIAIGGSSKGLGAAGIDADEELKRVEVLINDAKAAGLKIVSAHIGGAGRRGTLGDRYIEPVVKESDYVIVVKSGNQDGIFTDLCSQYEVPLTEIDAITDCVAVMGAAFKK